MKTYFQDLDYYSFICSFYFKKSFSQVYHVIFENYFSNKFPTIGDTDEMNSLSPVAPNFTKFSECQNILGNKEMLEELTQASEKRTELVGDINFSTNPTNFSDGSNQDNQEINSAFENQSHIHIPGEENGTTKSRFDLQFGSEPTAEPLTLSDVNTATQSVAESYNLQMTKLYSQKCNGIISEETSQRTFESIPKSSRDQKTRREWQDSRCDSFAWRRLVFAVVLMALVFRCQAVTFNASAVNVSGASAQGE